MRAYTPVEKYEADFEYNPDWGGPAPVLWLPAAWQPNCGNDKVFDLSPWCQTPGTWAGSTAQRNVVTDWGRVSLFNGSDDTLVVPLPTSWSAASACTLELWARATTGITLKCLCNVAAEAGNGGQLVLLYFAAGYNGLLASHAVNSDYSAKPAAAITQTNWNHIVVTCPGGAAALTMFTSGALNSAAGGDFLSRGTSTHELELGAKDGAGFASCQVQSCALYPGVLSPAQIRLLYESSLDGSPGVKARPIGPRWFPAAVAGDVTGDIVQTIPRYTSA